MPAQIELPFLYQTRTILRVLPRVSCTTRRRRLISSQIHPDPPEDQDIAHSQHEPGSFLREKARQVATSSKVPASIPTTVGTRINSTITASERRAFETILRFTPKQAEPSGVKQQSPLVDAVDTDIENILDIFSSSMKSYHAGREGIEAGQLEPKAGSGSGSDSSHHSLSTDDTAQRIAETLNETDANAELEPAPTPYPAVSNAEAQPTHQAQPTLSAPPTTAPALGEQSLQEITQSLQFSRHDEAIQEEVRTRLTEIAHALQAAATSTTKRGDLAMWEVCETQIFSLARQLAPKPRETRSRLTDPPRFRFTFSKSHSDNPTELIEAAADSIHEGSSSSSSSSPSSSSPSSGTINLPLLHQVYPSALLLALRLYIQHFPSSPLAHNLLPRIRAHGHTSYVLGASPQFYNSLISLVWLTRSSLRHVDALLAEMERGGLDLTEETYRILRQIEDERAADLGREDGHAGVLKGSRGAAWWKRHEQVFWFPRILDWLAVVAKRLTVKDMVQGGGGGGGGGGPLEI